MRFTCGVTYAGARMSAVLVTLLHLVVTAAKLCGPGGVRAVIAENLLLKQQVIVLRRPRQRAPNLTSTERVLCGLESIFLGPGRIDKVAIGVRPATLLAFHQALVRRKYRRLFSLSRRHKKPGPKGPSEALIRAIVELKSRNPRFGCPRIARIITQTFGLDIDKNVVYRVLSKHYRQSPGGGGPVDGSSLCRMFNDAVRGQGAPRHLSTDHDPLFEGHRWHAHLRVLEIDAIKTVPYVPMSHPYVERLIGTMRREFLDHVLFWNARDLERKLADFTTYYNGWRSHASLAGNTPLGIAAAGQQPVHSAELDHVRWVSHCRGLVKLPMAA